SISRSGQVRVSLSGKRNGSEAFSLYQEGQLQNGEITLISDSSPITALYLVCDNKDCSRAHGEVEFPFGETLEFEYQRQIKLWMSNLTSSSDDCVSELELAPRLFFSDS